MKITRLKVTNYRGVAAIEAEIPPAGAVFSGKNRAGKTSLLKAIRAALAAQDIGPDAIRVGAEKAEIMIDLDDFTVRRAITRKGDSLTITTAAGDRKAKPQSFLAELLGTAPLDPLDLFLAPKKARRALVLAALPVRVTSEQLAKLAPGLPAGFDASGHGLEVLERARKWFYERRTQANAAAKSARAAAQAAAFEEARARDAAPEKAPTPAEADAALSRARAALAQLQAQDAESKRAAERTAGTRKRIEELRGSAATLRQTTPDLDPHELDEERTRKGFAEETVACLRRDLAAAELALKAQADRVAALEAKDRARAAAHERAGGLEHQAADLEATIAAAAVAPVAPATIEWARADVAAAEEARRAADLAAAAAEALATSERIERAAAGAEAEAARLDALVRALTDDAPKALLAGTAGIPGLTIEDEDIYLDGKRIDALSGQEQMRFAVEIAKRMNAKSKILICDGLERLDSAAFEQFVGFATAGGFQLIASCVRDGELVLEAIELEEAPR